MGRPETTERFRRKARRVRRHRLCDRYAMPHIAIAAAAGDIRTRVDDYGWTAIEQELDSSGWAVLRALLTADETGALERLYDDDGLFRSRVVMAKHGFGRGEYKYFKYPLP